VTGSPLTLLRSSTPTRRGATRLVNGLADAFLVGTPPPPQPTKPPPRLSPMPPAVLDNLVGLYYHTRLLYEQRARHLGLLGGARALRSSGASLRPRQRHPRGAPRWCTGLWNTSASPWRGGWAT